ncbi:MAG: hypothetical protein GY947_11715 [Rhodobacteraceae bacterium]|nr:hypothetical protein [Paracoccaceae bacterium]
MKSIFGIENLQALNFKQFSKVGFSDTRATFDDFETGRSKIFPFFRTVSDLIPGDISRTETNTGHEQMRTEKRWMKWVLKEAAKIAATEAKAKA